MEKRCYAIGGRVNFNEDTVSLCHGMDIGDKIIWRYDSGEPFTPQYYLDKVKELNQKNQTSCPECEGCSNLLEGEKEKNKLEIITINPMNYCQNRCVYCGNFQGEIKELYNPLPMIKDFMDKGLVADNCLFDWGGGEPTLSHYFEETFLFLLENGYMQRVNTNAVKLSEVLLSHLDDELVTLRFSLDAGNEKAFLATKGRNLFNQVVKNITEYSHRTKNIVLKYVVTCTNSDSKSIKDFVNLAADIGISAICIDTEMFSFGANNYNGLLSFTEKELEAAHLLRKLAHAKGLNVQIGYVWTAQNNNVPSRDFNYIKSIKELNENDERYEIPQELLPVHKERIDEYKKGIRPIVLAGFETLLSEMKNKKVILYGAGNNGSRMLKCLRKYHIQVCAVCDKNKQGSCLDDILIKDIKEVLKEIDDNTCVLITPYCAKEIIIEFNEQNYAELKGKLYYIDGFRCSKRILEDLTENA